jgi:hypothetical protein
MNQERRRLRFAFSASTEIAPHNLPTSLVPVRVTELSLRGCFVETSVSFEMRLPVSLNILQLWRIFRSRTNSPLHQTL